MTVEPGADTERARALGRLEDAFALRFTGRAEGARLARVEIDAARARGDLATVAAAEVVYNYCLDVPETPAAALEQLRRAHDGCAAAGDDKNQVRAADLLATIFEAMGDYKSAVHYAETAREVARRSGDRLFEGFALSSLAGVFTAVGDLDAAETKIAAGLKIGDELSSISLKARFQLRLGRVKRLRGDLDAALHHFGLARELGVGDTWKFTAVEVHNEIARVHILRRDYAAAEAALADAERVADDDTRRISGPRTMLELARVYAETDRLVDAERVLAELEASAETFNLMPVLADAMALLAEVYERMGDPMRALAKLRRHLELRETVMRDEAQRAVNRSQTRMELQAAQKDAEINRLKYVELKAMQTQLLEAERMAGVANLAAGLAHEMNTPLGVVRSGLDTSHRALDRLEGTIDSDRTVQAALSALRSAYATSDAAAERLSGLVANLRRFTRLDEASLQRFDLVEELKLTLSLIEPSLPGGVRVESDLRPVPAIEGWPGSLNQAFHTLFTNAIEVLGEGGTIRVSTAADRTDAVVRIADDGPGIPETVRDRLFEPGFAGDGGRTRFRVGLATVRSVVQRHGGRIDFDTAGGEGTTFTLRFPAARGP